MQWINHKSWKKVNGNKNCSILKDSSYLNENTVWTIGNTMYYPGLNSEIKPSLTRVLPLMYQTCRPWWCWGCHDTPDLWHISYVTLFQQGGQIMPPHHYWHPQIFRPSYGPVYVPIDLQFWTSFTDNKTTRKFSLLINFALFRLNF